MRQTRQPDLQFPEPKRWGGARRGAGRNKRKHGVAHASRSRVSKHDPRLVTLKIARDLPNLRTRPVGDRITNCIRAAQKSSFRIVHYTIQTDHLHLIVEADDREALANGMKGFTCRLARGLNKLWQRRGKVFPERFHGIALTTLRQVRNALRYVLNNYIKHFPRASTTGAPTSPDPFSSGRYFDGWRGRARELRPGTDGATVAAPCWKIREGWKRHYRAIALDAMPGRVAVD